MEQIEEDSLRLEICEKCYEHQNYDMHSEKQYQQAYQQLLKQCQQIGITIVRNLPPKYITKVPDSRTSTKRYIDSNISKIIQFPSRGSFEVYYKQIYVYSKLQTSIFPNIQYLILIIKVLKELCYLNPGLLSRLEKFRCLEYEWRKTNSISQTLYHYLKLNACGNQSESCIRQILQSFGQRRVEQGGKNKKKIIHPYILFENREKMYKMESIYCPKTAFSQFLNKQPGKEGKKWLKMRTHRPQTGFIQRKQNIKQKDNSCTQRSINLKGAGNNRKHIFQMVIKQENKNLDEQKIRNWMKRQKLSIEGQDNWKSELKKDHVNFQRKYNKSVELKSRKKGKEVFLSFISKSRPTPPNKLVKNKIEKIIESANQKGKLNVDSKTSKNESFVKISNSQNKRKSIVQDEKLNENKSILEQRQNINSSRFGVIKKNSSQPSDSQNILKSNDNQSSVKLQKSIDFLPSTVNPIQSSPLKKSSVSSQMGQPKSLDQEKKMQIDEIKMQNFETKALQMSESLSSQNQATQINQQIQKRALIESKTVQKRINERKRSCNHQRHSQNVFLRLNSFQKQGQLYQKINQSKIDTIVEQIPQYSPQWNALRKNQQRVREPALILKKFCKPLNFTCYNQYQEKYQQIIKCSENSLVKFQIKGEQLTSKFVIKSIQHLFKPNQLKLFPQIFKQVQFCNNSLVSQNKHISGSRFKSPHSKLIQLVNLMLRSNPMMISRIFEDKKYINPYGVYCVWLKDQNGKMQAVFVNDQFAFQEVIDDGAFKAYKPVYSWLGNQNSLWYMLLEKAIAKILGGYHMISQLSLSQLMNIILASPTVDLGYVDPEKASKIFTEKIFYNKMISVYSLRESSKPKEGKRIDRIIGFSFNKRQPKESAIHLKVQQSTVTFTYKEFLLVYSQSSLLFFNNNYFLNQSPLVIKGTKREVLSCRLSCKNSKNNCYLLFSNFPEKLPTKVSLYRQLNDEEAEITQGMNPLSEQQRRYCYVGEICKTGHFFFEVQINAGNFICLMENQFDKNPFVSIYSEYPIQIEEILSSDLQLQQNKFKNKKEDKKKNKGDSKVSERSKISKVSASSATPKVIIERRILVPEFEDEKLKVKKEKQIKKKKQIKIAKEYAYFHDNIQDVSNESDDNKQNDLGIQSKLEDSKKGSKIKKKQLKKIKEKQSDQQMSVPTEKSLKKENEQNFIEKVTAIRSRIVSNYD